MAGQQKRNTGDARREPTKRGSAPQKKKVSYSAALASTQSTSLTVREEEVHHWVVRGKENDEGAQILGANVETIRKHVENIRTKTDSESRLALLADYWLAEVDKRDAMIADLRRQLRELRGE